MAAQDGMDFRFPDPGRKVDRPKDPNIGPSPLQQSGAWNPSPKGQVPKT